MVLLSKKFNHREGEVEYFLFTFRWSKNQKDQKVICSESNWNKLTEEIDVIDLTTKKTVVG